MLMRLFEISWYDDMVCCVVTMNTINYKIRNEAKLQMCQNLNIKYQYQ